MALIEFDQTNGEVEIYQKSRNSYPFLKFLTWLKKRYIGGFTAHLWDSNNEKFHGHLSTYVACPTQEYSSGKVSAVDFYFGTTTARSGLSTSDKAVYDAEGWRPFFKGERLSDGRLGRRLTHENVGLDLASGSELYLVDKGTGKRVQVYVENGVVKAKVL